LNRINILTPGATSQDPTFNWIGMACEQNFAQKVTRGSVDFWCANLDTYLGQSVDVETQLINSVGYRVLVGMLNSLMNRTVANVPIYYRADFVKNGWINAQSTAAFSAAATKYQSYFQACAPSTCSYQVPFRTCASRLRTGLTSGAWCWWVLRVLSDQSTNPLLRVCSPDSVVTRT
jgi:hypothetical protein